MPIYYEIPQKAIFLLLSCCWSYSVAFVLIFLFAPRCSIYHWNMEIRKNVRCITITSAKKRSSEKNANKMKRSEFNQQQRVTTNGKSISGMYFNRKNHVKVCKKQPNKNIERNITEKKILQKWNRHITEQNEKETAEKNMKC